MATKLPELPGKQVTTNVPNLPGVGVIQPSRSSIQQLEDKWNSLSQDKKQAIADIIDLVNKHPELAEWAKASKMGYVGTSSN